VTPARRSLGIRLPVGACFIALALAVVQANLSSDRAWPVAAFLLIGIVLLVVPTEAGVIVIPDISASRLPAHAAPQIVKPAELRATLASS
jgi:hypothetical protein